MFYDEGKSPYQYRYGAPLLKKRGIFSFHNEIERIEHLKMIRNYDVAIQNYIKLYNAKNELLHLIFSLYDAHDICNISFGGSYLTKKYNQLSDIDINLIVKGTMFYYENIPSDLASKYVKNISNKISIMVFGEDLLLNDSFPWNDFILTPHYLHRDLRMRECSVRSFRNVNIYGNIYETNMENEWYLANITTRIKRQLKFAELVFDGLFDHYSTEETIIRKMSSRIGEAGILLSNFENVDTDKYYKIFSGDLVLDPYELLREGKSLQKYLEH